MGKGVTEPLYTIKPIFKTGDESTGRCKGPCRVASFCVLSVVLPATLISVALLMRFVVCGSSTYFLAPSDMMILDQGISTTWCQGERVQMNTTFTAYTTTGEPVLKKSSEPMIFKKTLMIPDDHKEYWGFYLLEGSNFTLSTCAKFKGATVLVVLGRSHLHDCAYIGNADSAGNSDEHSDSTSVESTRLAAGSVRRLSNTTSSLEQMSQILNQIQSYVKTHPRGYHHLQRHLFGILHPNDTESPRHHPRNTGEQHGTIFRRHVPPRFDPGADAAFEEDLTFDQNETERSPLPLKSIWSEHHLGHFNFTTSYQDGSDSESESSYSSSEEALARCKGIVGIFYLNRSLQCGSGDIEGLKFNYAVKESGFYYFIFGSENEKTTNLISVHLEVDRFQYDLPAPLTNCTNTRKCEVPLDFASNQKFVVSIPPSLANSWDEIFYVETDCIPRASLYLIFVLMIPLLILIFAFQ